MEHAVNVVASIQESARQAVLRAEGLGVRHGKRVSYAGLHGLHPCIVNLPCGCSLTKVNGQGESCLKVTSVHIEESGAVIHVQCNREIARIVREEPNGGM
jgi:hypothetical protein